MKLNFLYPVARMVGVGREYFEDEFLEEMSSKVAEIPEENVITPSPIVVMPTFQALSYSLEEPNLKEMYLNLLAAASDDRAYNKAGRAASAQTVPGMTGIPEFKLLSNGPWLVSSAEIRQALGHYQASAPGLQAELEADDLWRSWIEWLRETADHGGFTVN